MRAFEVDAEKRKPEVYVDMDGVLADFFHEYAKLAGVPADKFGKHDYRSIPPASQDPTLDKMVGTDFFARLPECRNAQHVVEMAVELAMKTLGDPRLQLEQLDKHIKTI